VVLVKTGRKIVLTGILWNGAGSGINSPEFIRVSLQSKGLEKGMQIPETKPGFIEAGILGRKLHETACKSNIQTKSNSPE